MAEPGGTSKPNSSCSSGALKSTSRARAGEALVKVMSTCPSLSASMISATRANSTTSTGTCSVCAIRRPSSSATPADSPVLGFFTQEVGLPGYTPTRKRPEGAKA